jgi:hypothetical protein
VSSGIQCQVSWGFSSVAIELSAVGAAGPPVASLCIQLSGSFTNLVDPASSHMLVSKIKPCMSQYKLLYGETANGSLKQL